MGLKQFPLKRCWFGSLLGEPGRDRLPTDWAPEQISAFASGDTRPELEKCPGERIQVDGANECYNISPYACGGKFEEKNGQCYTCALEYPEPLPERCVPSVECQC